MVGREGAERDGARHLAVLEEAASVTSSKKAAVRDGRC